ncbi:hypothetical protein [Hwangdonia lutea]|uniref:Magnesium citrate secondary transporter n=1 Tax=Hwangdonia lutea TaxID=3075823 RepID=A0AA97EM89_9FLAO|nr:hypothetical protein [Hwangdonia sp. SCSIO 19198]WOD43902.1 hypothetical protein RNZ46_01260 [Hwangdonia sp. SCSIO 19198]
MKILKHPFFISVCIMAIVIYLAKISHVVLPDWVYFYLGDLLCMPFVLSLCLVVVRLINNNDSLYIPLGPIIVLTAFYALYFEWLLPKYNARYTADIIDVVMYVTGSGLFYLFQKRLYK